MSTFWKIQCGAPSAILFIVLIVSNIYSLGQKLRFHDFKQISNIFICLDEKCINAGKTRLWEADRSWYEEIPDAKAKCKRQLCQHISPIVHIASHQRECPLGEIKFDIDFTLPKIFKTYDDSLHSIKEAAETSLENILENLFYPNHKNFLIFK